MTALRVLRVALDMPLTRLFDYLPPAPLRSDFAIEPGMRVGVPFGRQRLKSYRLEQTSRVTGEMFQARKEFSFPSSGPSHTPAPLP